jgi:SSS family solute:Na+ symporter
MWKLLIAPIVLGSVPYGRASAVAEEAAHLSREAKQRAIKLLQTALTEESGFVKVHAAETLLALSLGNQVLPTFRNELKVHGDEPHYRTGIYRVLARAEPRAADRQRYIDRLREIYLDESSPDRIHALEALAKLMYVVPVEERPHFVAIAPAEPDAEPCLRWLFANSRRMSDLRALEELLESESAEVRGLTAYALRHLKDVLPRDVVQKLTRRAPAEQQEPAKIHLLAAAFVTAPPEAAAEFKPHLIRYLNASEPKAKYQSLLALAERGTREDSGAAIALLMDVNADVRIGSAFAALRIDRRRPSSFNWLDWAVLLAYAAGMLGIGWYFSRQQTNSDEYIFAGRSMKALPVGLSYFATLFSTVSYLSAPGEVIAHGPLVIGTILSFPFVFVIVGYFLIPFIMRLDVTSAYEILEKRFGLSVRLLGSSIFLALRLAWMAMILFGMSRVVLVPLLGLPVWATPWVAAILGLLTVSYTAMGGLKAVIWTDVAQTVVLMAGAILCIVLGNVYLGGIGEWWPREWPSQWEAPRFWFDTGARVTLAGAALSQFCWYICTAGSDQMAVQRYLATKNSSQARRMFAISLICDACVAVLLVLIGLTLFAYFSRRPDMLPDGETLVSGADQLFPRFIVTGLPAGVTGLVIAGLAAAAMSSLSSGVSSTSSVVTIDWIDRFRTRKFNEQAKVRVARVMSWVIGAVIVVLSLFALGIGGNLYEKAFKFINLFTAPLFVLFFMAMFVPRATTWSAWAAGLASWGTAVLIAYTKLTGLSFFWIMPLALFVGVIVGGIASVIPVGTRRPMLQLKENAIHQTTYAEPTA